MTTKKNVVSKKPVKKAAVKSDVDKNDLLYVEYLNTFSRVRSGLSTESTGGFVEYAAAISLGVADGRDDPKTDPMTRTEFKNTMKEMLT